MGDCVDGIKRLLQFETPFMATKPCSAALLKAIRNIVSSDRSFINDAVRKNDEVVTTVSHCLDGVMSSVCGIAL